MIAFETIEIRCPDCGVTYIIRKDDLNEGKVHCMKCGCYYYQKYNLAHNFAFVNRFWANCVGEK